MEYRALGRTGLTVSAVSLGTVALGVDYGIAAPDALSCPQCGSARATLISEFGSTACKALYRCEECSEPFDYFKPH